MVSRRFPRGHLAAHEDEEDVLKKFRKPTFDMGMARGNKAVVHANAPGQQKKLSLNGVTPLGEKKDSQLDAIRRRLMKKLGRV